MIRRFSRIFASPVFEGDEKNTRAAGFLNVILWTMFIGAFLAIPLVFIAPVGTMLSRLGAILAVELLALALIRLMHSGYVRLVSTIAVLGVWAITNLAILFGGGGVRSIGFPGNLIVVLIAGILLGRRASLSAAGFCIATGIAFIIARQTGMIPDLPIRDTDQETLIVYSIHLIVAAVLLNLTLRNVEHALAQAHREIEERVLAQERLRANEILLRAIINNIPFDLWVCDANDRYIIQNAISYELAGDLSGKTVEDLDISSDLLAEYKDKHLRALRGEKISEEVGVSVRGEKLYVLSVQSPVLDNDKILGFVGMNIDMTDYKRVEEELRASQERFSLAVDGSNDGIWDWNIRANTNYASPRWYDMLGYAPGEIEYGEGMDLILSLIHPDDKERFLETNENYLTGRSSTYEMEFRLRHKDGSYRWILSRGKALRDEHGQLYRMTGSHTDITDRKRAEQVQLASLQIAEAALTQDLTEFYPSVYAIISPLIPARNFYITLHDLASDTFTTPFLVDEFYSKWLPYRPGKGLGAFVLRTGKPLLATPEVFAEMERQGQVVILDRRMVEWLGVPLKTREGKIIGVMAVQNYYGPPRLGALHMDLLVFVSVQVAMAIERKQAEAERENLIRELTAKNAELERFTYTVSHDLKAPLVTISGFLGYLEQDAVSGNIERLKQDTLRIQDAANKMHLLLNELLELSRIGRVMNPPEKIQFEDLVCEASDIVHGRLEASGITVHIQPHLPFIYGDRQRLVEVLQNLLDNAAKFMGDQPNPHIEIGQSGEEEGNPVFYVKDNGIGIAPEYHERIFGLFNKLDPKMEGTGVGLALAKRIIEFHGGRIWVESKPGSGSTFSFTLSNSNELKSEADQ